MSVETIGTLAVIAMVYGVPILVIATIPFTAWRSKGNRRTIKDHSLKTLRRLAREDEERMYGIDEQS